MFSLRYGRLIRKLNIHTKINMIIYKLMYRTFAILELLYGIWGSKEWKRE
jgi:hypothetical protein